MTPHYLSDCLRLHRCLKRHIGHNITCVAYGNDDSTYLKCTDCNEVLISVETLEEDDE